MLNREVGFALNNGHRQPSLSGPKSAQKRPSNWLMIKPHDDQELLRLPAYLRALRRQARI
jgi:hypothetical protein